MSTGIETRLPVYESLVQRIRTDVQAEKLRPGVLIGTEHGLVRQTGLSRTSIRKAIDCLVEEGLVERRAGKGVFVRRPQSTMQTVQVIVGNLRWEPWAYFTQGAKAAAGRRATSVQVCDAHGSVDQDLDMLRELPRRGVDGAIIVSLHHLRFAELLFELKSQGFPFVLADERLRYVDVPSVMADNHGGGYAVGKALVEQGHQRIAFVGDLAAQTVEQRLAGLRDAVNDAGLAFDRKLVIDLQEGDNRLGDWSAQVMTQVQRLMNNQPRPTAIFFSCDGVAASGAKAIKAMNLRIPQDVSVVGFDDSSWLEFLDPPLASVRQPFMQMGASAMDMLLDQIAGRAPSPAEHRVFPVQYVHRPSVGPAPAITPL